jgi:hypothetical protein
VIYNMHICILKGHENTSKVGIRKITLNFYLTYG